MLPLALRFRIAACAHRTGRSENNRAIVIDHDTQLQ